MLTSDLLVDWNSNAFTLDKWSHLFKLVSNSPAEGPTLFTNLEVKEIVGTKSEARHTPDKRGGFKAQGIIIQERARIIEPR
jgi:hypothetical protein